MATLRCPICRKSFASEQSPASPFCSLRCRQIDLKRWLGEEYGLPHVSDDESEEAEPSSEAEKDEASESDDPT